MARPWRTRRFFRVLYESPVLLRVNRKHRAQVRLAQKNLAAKIVDLSEGGCGLEGDFFVPKGTIMNVFLDRTLLQVAGAPAVPKGHSRITAMVMSAVTRGVRSYRIGMQFVKVSPRDKALISQFIKFHERRKDPRVEF